MIPRLLDVNNMLEELESQAENRHVVTQIGKMSISTLKQFKVFHDYLNTKKLVEEEIYWKESPIIYPAVLKKVEIVVGDVRDSDLINYL